MKKSHWWILAFNALYLIVFGAYYVIIQNYEFLVYISVIVIIGLIIAVNLHKSKLDNLILWLLSIWGFVHMIGGGIRIGGHTVYSLHLIDIVNKGGDFYNTGLDLVFNLVGALVGAFLAHKIYKNTLKRL